MGVERLLFEYSIAAAREINNPKNKTYPKERLALEKELIKRLGGDWSEYARLNGWEEE
jgi:hypothetical protein